jgi:hypothetical protein
MCFFKSEKIVFQEPTGIWSFKNFNIGSKFNFNIIRPKALKFVKISPKTAKGAETFSVEIYSISSSYAIFNDLKIKNIKKLNFCFGATRKNGWKSNRHLTEHQNFTNLKRRSYDPNNIGFSPLKSPNSSRKPIFHKVKRVSWNQRKPMSEFKRNHP